MRGMHRRVQGTYVGNEGIRSYAASDQDLLRWVHVAFTDSFLATHRVWGKPIPGGEDAYVREWAISGELVGLQDPPRSVAELREQVDSFLPVLRGDADARATVEFVRKIPMPLVAAPAYASLFAGAVATMPDEHRELLGLDRLPLSVVRPVVGTLLGGLGLALGPQSPSMQAAMTRVAHLESSDGPRPADRKPDLHLT